MLLNCYVMKIKYVPRHLRIGVNLTIPVLECTHDVEVSVPVVDKTGVVSVDYKDVKTVPVSETIGKYKVGDFSLKNLQKAGVPLKLFNLNRSLGYRITELENACKGLENSEQFVNRILAERKEKESWLQPVKNEEEN